MNGIQKTIILGFCLSLSGCATQSLNKNSDQRLDKQAQIIKELSEKVDLLKEENLVLRELTGVGESSSLKEQTPASLRGSKDKLTGEQALYQQVIEAYRSGQRAQLERARDTFIKFHPQSVHADNAYYLSGLLAMEADDIPAALKIFDKMLSLYPKGNKRGAALYAKGMAYKKLNLPEQARSFFQEVLGAYPGSPEARQASVELRLLHQ